MGLIKTERACYKMPLTELTYAKWHSPNSHTFSESKTLAYSLEIPKMIELIKHFKCLLWALCFHKNGIN